MNPAAALFQRPAMVCVLMTAACSIEPRTVQIVDGAAGASGHGGTSVVRDASEETSDARAGSDGAGGVGGAGGRNDASIDGNAEPDGSSGAGGRAGAGGGTGSGGTGGGTGSGGAAGAGATGGIGGTGGAGGGAGGGGAGGAAGIAGAGGVAGIAGAGGVAGIAGGGGAGTTGGSGGGAGSGTGGTTGGSGGMDAGTTGGAAGQTGSDAGDVRIVDANLFDKADGGIIVLFEEDFIGGLNTFTVAKGCGTPPLWEHRQEEAHAEDPATLGVNSIVSQTISIPANVSDLRLRLRHQVETEAGYDGAQLLLSKNGAAPVVVTSFTTGGYVNGSNLNGDTCAERPEPDWWPAWSGSLPLFESEVNLSAAPLNVVPGDTVSIRLRMLVDSVTAGGGWDVDWVRVTGTLQ